MASVQSTMIMVFMIVPMLAPSAGQALLLIAGWRWIFGIMAVMALLILALLWRRLPETLNPDYRQALELRQVLRITVATVSARDSFGYVFAVPLTQGTVFAFVVSSQQLLGEHFGFGAMFPLLFGVMALAMSAANFVNSRIVERFGARRVSHTALFAVIAVSALQLWLALRGGETIWQFLPLTTLNMCLIGFTTANFSAIAMQPFARNAGAAAASQAFIRAVGIAAIAALVGQNYDGSARPLAIGLLGGGVLALALILISERGRLFHHVPARR